MRSITAIGDSITKGIVADEWPYKLLVRLGESTLTADRFEPFTGGTNDNRLIGSEWTFYNAGIDANTTAQMLDRFDTDVLGHTSDYLIIHGGVNDVNGGATASEITDNLAAMYAKADAASLPYAVATLLPWTGTTDARRDIIDSVNTWIRAHSASESVPLIEWFLAVEYPNASRLMPLSTPNYTNDGLHPNATGNTALAAVIPLWWMGVSKGASIQR
jgi:lysophospholipase L1-like esterase